MAIAARGARPAGFRIQLANSAPFAGNAAFSASRLARDRASFSVDASSNTAAVTVRGRQDC